MGEGPGLLPDATETEEKEKIPRQGLLSGTCMRGDHAALSSQDVETRPRGMLCRFTGLGLAVVSDPAPTHRPPPTCPSFVGWVWLAGRTQRNPAMLCKGDRELEVGSASPRPRGKSALERAWAPGCFCRPAGTPGHLKLRTPPLHLEGLRAALLKVGA